MNQAPSGDNAPLHRRPVLYPNHYAWFVLFSAMDIMLTHTILGRFGAFGGRELNSIADWVIKQFGLWGAIGLKFATVILVVFICELVGSKSASAGRKLARMVVILAIFPVAWELAALAWFALKGDA
jgi:hypothetical protein